MNIHSVLSQLILRPFSSQKFEKAVVKNYNSIQLLANNTQSSAKSKMQNYFIAMSNLANSVFANNYYYK